MALALDGIHREDDTVEYRDRRRKAFSGLSPGFDPELAASRMRDAGMAEWEIELAYAMVSDADFRKSVEEKDPIKRSVMVSSIARRNGLDLVSMHGMYVDAMVGSGLMDENEQFDCYVDLSDADEDAKELLKKAEAGDADAQYAIGLRYRRGEGVFEDEDESVRWLSAAAEQGHPGAMYEMGVSFYSGIGVPMDEVAAEEWFRKAADAGHPEAKRLVG